MNLLLNRMGFISICLVIISLFGCTEKVSEYTPENLINTVLSEPDIPEPFYAEMEWIMNEKGNVTEHLLMKHWYDYDGKYRIEIENPTDGEQAITVNDGQSIIVYSVEDNEAFITNDSELFSMNQPSFKEQANYLLEAILETHTVEVVGEEKIAGRQTHHLVATAKEDDILLGNQELWIDKKNWMVLKQINNSGDMTLEMVYKTIDFRKKMPAELFTLDLPKNVQIHYESDLDGRTVSLEEAIIGMDKPFLYFRETNDLKIANIQFSEHDEEQQLVFDYEKNGLPFLELTVYEMDIELFDELSELMDGEPIQVRGHKGYYSGGSIRMVEWMEEDLTYSVVFVDPNLTLEQFNELTEDMDIDF